MIDLLLTWFLSALGIFITSRLVPGFEVKEFGSAFFICIVVGLLNMTLKPFLWLLTLPITLLTLGLFTFVINAIVLKVAARLMKDFTIHGWWPAIIGAFVLSIVNMVLFNL
jgi:putative membrane protein